MREFVEAVTWPLAGLSLLGAWANVNQKRWGFYVWCVTNGSWVAIYATYAIYASVVLHSAFFYLSVRGLVKWRKK